MFKGYFRIFSVCVIKNFVLLCLDASNDEAEGKNDSEDETQQRRAYSLREHKPRTQLYMAPAIGMWMVCVPSDFLT